MIDTHRSYLESARANARRAERHVTLDRSPFQPSKAKRSRLPADPAPLLDYLATLVGGDPPPDAPIELGELLEILDVPGHAAGDFWLGCAAAIAALGPAGDAARERQSRGWQSAVGGGLPPLPSACGARARTRIEPRQHARRCEEFAALVSAETGLAVAGNASGYSTGAIYLARDLVRALRAGASRGDAHATRRAGQDFGVLAVVLSRTKEGAGEAGQPHPPNSEPRLVQVGRNHDAAPGQQLVRRSANQIIGIEVDGQLVPMNEVEFVDGRVQRRAQSGHRRADSQRGGFCKRLQKYR